MSRYPASEQVLGGKVLRLLWLIAKEGLINKTSNM